MSIPETPSPSRSASHFWLALGDWLKRGTHPAPWLPSRWHHPALGYLAAVLLALLAAGVTLLLNQLFPSFGFHQGLLILVIVLVALSWGQGPSLLTTLLGAFLLIVVVTPPGFTWELHDLANLIDLLLYLAEALVISLLASQTGQARWRAEQLAHEAELARWRAEQLAHDAEVARHFLAQVLEVLPVGVCLVDTTGHLRRRNAALEALGVDVAPLVARVIEREEKIVAEEHAIPTGEGDVKTVLTFGVPVGDGLGVVQGGVVIVVDISERKQLEEALRAANQRMDVFLGIAS